MHEGGETLQDDLVSTVRVLGCVHDAKYRRCDGPNQSSSQGGILHESDVGKVNDYSSSQSKSSLELENARNEFESLWRRYLNWRCGGARDAQLVPPQRTQPSVCMDERVRSFALLNELEAHARAVLRTRFSSNVPQAFVMAVIETAADTTARFMQANASDAERYCGLAFEMLWSGLSAIEASQQEPKYERREDATNAIPRFER